MTIILAEKENSLFHSKSCFRKLNRICFQPEGYWVFQDENGVFYSGVEVQGAEKFRLQALLRIIDTVYSKGESNNKSVCLEAFPFISSDSEGVAWFLFPLPRKIIKQLSLVSESQDKNRVFHSESDLEHNCYLDKRIESLPPPANPFYIQVCKADSLEEEAMVNEALELARELEVTEKKSHPACREDDNSYKARFWKEKNSRNNIYGRNQTSDLQKISAVKVEKYRKIFLVTLLLGLGIGGGICLYDTENPYDQIAYEQGL